MARTFAAKKSNADKGIKCGRCNAAVVPGEMYYYFSVGFRGSKSYRGKLHRPKQRELCGNKMSGAYAANEGLEAEINDPEATVSSIASALESAASDIESVRDEYQDSFDSLPQGFQDGDTGSDIQEKIDGLTAYAEALAEKASEVSGLESALDDIVTDLESNPYADDPADPAEDLIQQARDLADEVLSEFSL